MHFLWKLIKCTVVCSGGGWSSKVSPPATEQFWSYSISWSQLSDVWFFWQRKSWQDKMSIESPILCTPALSHRLRLCPQQQKSVGVQAALPEALLPVVLNNWPLLAKGCQSGAQYSPRFILSLIVSASLSPVFDISHTVGAISRLTQYYTQLWLKATSCTQRLFLWPSGFFILVWQPKETLMQLNHDSFLLQAFCRNRFI